MDGSATRWGSFTGGAIELVRFVAATGFEDLKDITIEPGRIEVRCAGSVDALQKLPELCMAAGNDLAQFRELLGESPQETK